MVLLFALLICPHVTSHYPQSTSLLLSLSLSLSLSVPLCPPSCNDLAITGAAVPALVSQGVWGLIGTEWARVCGTVKPHWYRLGFRGTSLIEMYYRGLYKQTHTHTLKHISTCIQNLHKRAIKHANPRMFKFLSILKLLIFSFNLLWSES